MKRKGRAVMSSIDAFFYVKYNFIGNPIRKSRKLNLVEGGKKKLFTPFFFYFPAIISLVILVLFSILEI